MPRPSTSLQSSALAAAAALALTQLASAQVTFSIDRKGPTVGTPSCGALLGITPSDVIAPCTAGLIPAPGPLPAPRLVIPGGAGGLGLAAGADVDALSYGFDAAVVPNQPRGSWWFSVRRESTGLPGPFPPNVASETPAPVSEGASDLFIDLGIPVGPVPPGIGGNTLAVDGNGMPAPGPLGYPGLGVVEPHGFCAAIDPGDNVDALDLGLAVVPAAPPVYFSIDGGADPCGAAAFVAPFPPAAILVKPPAAIVPAVWAGPGALGLDFFGPGTDNLDALALWDNGMPGFQPSPGAYGWLIAGADMVLFSVSRGSAVVGMPDSVFGLPIQPGDILMPPVAGGVSGFPGIFIAAENLGLRTMRLMPGMPDDLDALDVVNAPLFDCNGNGQEDALDIASGLETDCNGNRVPDRCEFSIAPYCPTGLTSNGCMPSMSWSGVPSASLNCPFVVDINNVEGQKQGIIFYGITGPNAAPWGCGGSLLCVKAPTQRTGGQNSGGTVNACDGQLTLDFTNYMLTHPLAVGQPLFAGETFYMQGWFRDPPCGKATTHMSEALRFNLAP